jgi:hypothetical protein
MKILLNGHISQHQDVEFTSFASCSKTTLTRCLRPQMQTAHFSPRRKTNEPLLQHVGHSHRRTTGPL